MCDYRRVYDDSPFNAKMFCFRLPSIITSEETALFQLIQDFLAAQLISDLQFMCDLYPKKNIKNWGKSMDIPYISIL